MENPDSNAHDAMLRDANDLKKIAELDDNSMLADDAFKKLFINRERRALSQDELLGLEFTFSVYNAAVHQAIAANEKIEEELERLGEPDQSTPGTD